MNQPTKPLSVDGLLMELSNNSAGLALMFPKSGMTEDRSTELQLKLVDQAKAHLIELVKSVKPDQLNANDVLEHVYNRAYNYALEDYEQALIKAIEGETAS